MREQFASIRDAIFLKTIWYHYATLVEERAGKKLCLTDYPETVLRAARSLRQERCRQPLSTIQTLPVGTAQDEFYFDSTPECRISFISEMARLAFTAKTSMTKAT